MHRLIFALGSLALVIAGMRLRLYFGYFSSSMLPDPMEELALSRLGDTVEGGDFIG